MTIEGLLVFDLDGTLLDSEQRIPNDVRETLMSLRHRGIETTFATGRSLRSAQTVVQDLSSSLPLIVFNGAVVTSPDGNCLWSRRVPKTTARDALHLLRRPELDTFLYLEVDAPGFYAEHEGRSARHMMAKDGVECRIELDLEQLVNDHTGDPIKLFSIGPRETLEEVQEAFRAAHPGFTCVFSEHDMLEFLGSGVTKGAALAVLCKQLGVPIEKVVAFGDNLNDLEMIAAAGIGVSMHSGPLALMRVADDVAVHLGEYLQSRFAELLEAEEHDA